VYAKIRQQQFFDILLTHKAVAKKCRRTTKPVCNVKNYSRVEKFIADGNSIVTLPTQDFEVKNYFIKALKVAHNNHIYLE